MGSMGARPAGQGHTGIRRIRRSRIAVVTVAAALAAGLQAAPATPVASASVETASVATSARATPVLRRPSHDGSSVTFRGRARPRTAVRLQVRGGGRWTEVAVRRSSPSGRFSMTLPAPRRPRVFRAVAAGRASQSRRVDLAPAAPSAPVDACGPRVQRADGSSYSCTFHDEFDGTTLDRTRWIAQDTALTGVFTGQGGCYVDNDRAIRVDDGTLHLTATIRDRMFLCRSPYAPFPTRSEVATVATTHRFAQTYGRFSARMRFSAATGGHAAFWLSPQDHAYGKWPLSGEVDVAEWFGNDATRVYPSVHYLGEDKSQSTGRECPVPGATTGFHTYTVEWTPTEMRFLYDDRFCWSHSWTPRNVRAPAPFDQPFTVVLAQIWGSGWAARRTTSPTTTTLDVDWVRAWE
ncbi:glycoside hydrolase family 16 protein [Nocardioides daeguensis]|uniref:GH16 domain-containing protein n=1 Tax=Nocardioides daeguensis TaxID=908359 RepID=A0ABP6WCD9_9ACTN|nr:glycoside hydrolase family 16 protein [Nocardioides daeguensis]MBV6727988.1 glycoside hydrolase family 16 protein [Nocardioides daeguensis]MCR1774062.1 glycoside hydrolase family 16 protein [Nocardioides daeguensis]